MSPEPCTTLRCEADAWAQRATVAKWAAEELRECGQIISTVLASNYFGLGCSEASPIYIGLSNTVASGPSSWRHRLAEQAIAASHLAGLCTTGASAIVEQDQVGEQFIGR